MTSPTREDIGAMSALLQALPEFIDTHLMASEDELEHGLVTDHNSNSNNGTSKSEDTDNDNDNNIDNDENAVQTFELSPLHGGAVLTLSYPVEGVEFPEIDLMGDVDWLLDDAGLEDGDSDETGSDDEKEA